jgi:transposase
MLITERTDGDIQRLRNAVRRERVVAQRDRLRAVLLALEGIETLEIQRMLGRSRGFVQRWAYAYRDGGIEAIARLPYPGKPARIDGVQLKKLKARIDAGPTAKDKVCTLRGKDVQRILDQELGVKYSLQSVYDLLHRMGYSCLAPRPRHEYRNPEAQKKFSQESAPLLSAPFATRLNQAAGNVESISWTKRGSANKEH